MKRTAAIIGPTPSFLRWAIEHPCPLRELDLKNLPNSTFRQLRSLRELSLAIEEDRVLDGIAFHPDTCEAQPLIGFPVDEIADAFGGRDFIQSQCVGCFANCSSRANEVEGSAGCFGLVQIVDLPDLVQQIDQAANACELDVRLEQHFQCTSKTRAANPETLWYGLWVNRIVTPATAELLGELVSRLRDRSEDWRLFCVAVDRCVQHKLNLHVELFPPGESDGQRWNLVPHCSVCKAPSGSRVNGQCQMCGKQLVHQAQKKRKVLGLRPYMKLEHIFGQQKSDELRQRYLER